MHDLLKELKSSRPIRRWTAAMELGHTKDARAVPHLIELLHDPAWEVREHTVNALGEIGHPSAVPHLIALLQEDLFTSVRFHAASALGKIKDPSAIPALVDTLRDPLARAELRWNAAEALGEIGHEKIVPHLVKALEDSNTYVRGRAAVALGRIGHEAAIPHLIKMLEDPASSETLNAEAALVTLGQTLQKKKAGSQEAKALQLVAEHFQPKETASVVRQAYRGALAGKVTKANARLFIKQLRAVKGNVK